MAPLVSGPMQMRPTRLPAASLLLLAAAALLLASSSFRGGASSAFLAPSGRQAAGQLMAAEPRAAVTSSGEALPSAPAPLAAQDLPDAPTATFGTSVVALVAAGVIARDVAMYGPAPKHKRIKWRTRNNRINWYKKGDRVAAEALELAKGIKAGTIDFIYGKPQDEEYDDDYDDDDEYDEDDEDDEDDEEAASGRLVEPASLVDASLDAQLAGGDDPREVGSQRRSWTPTAPSTALSTGASPSAAEPPTLVQEREAKEESEQTLEEEPSISASVAEFAVTNFPLLAEYFGVKEAEAGRSSAETEGTRPGSSSSGSSAGGGGSSSAFGQFWEPEALLGGCGLRESMACKRRERKGGEDEANRLSPVARMRFPTDEAEENTLANHTARRAPAAAPAAVPEAVPEAAAPATVSGSEDSSGDWISLAEYLPAWVAESVWQTSEQPAGSNASAAAPTAAAPVQPFEPDEWLCAGRVDIVGVAYSKPE